MKDPEVTGLIPPLLPWLLEDFVDIPKESSALAQEILLWGSRERSVAQLTTDLG